MRGERDWGRGLKDLRKSERRILRHNGGGRKREGANKEKSVSAFECMQHLFR